MLNSPTSAIVNAYIRRLIYRIPINVVVRTGDEVSFSTTIAVETVASMPTSAYSVALFPATFAFADSHDITDDLVPGNPRQSAIPGQRHAITDKTIGSVLI